MSDKNFKVKNGIDAVGPITISPSSNSIDGIVINTQAGGKAIRFIRVGSGEVGSIDDWGTYSGNGINIVQPWYVRSPGVEAQSFFWVGSGVRSAAGFAGTNSGTNPVIYVSQNGSAANDLTQWIKSDNTVLAKVDYLGNITANDLTLAGNLTVNGTTTNLNSTNLIIEDKNIIIADVATPTNTTADGAGITIKGATDKTFNWVQSTGRFTSSEPIQSPSLVISTPTNTTNAGTFYNAAGTIVFNVDTSLNQVNIGGGLSGGANNFGSSWGYDSSVNAGFITFQTGALGGDSLAMRRTNHVASGDYTISTLGNMRLSTAIGKNFNFNNGNIGVATTAIGTNNKLIVNPYSTVDNLATVQINTNAATNKGLVVQGFTSQTANLQEWQDSAGTVLAKITPTGQIINDVAGAEPIIIRSSGGTKFEINQYGQGWSNTAFTFGNYYNTDSGTLPRLSVFTNGAGQKGAIIRGFASQTANLQEWQNSDSVVVAQVSATGAVTIRPVGFSGNLNTPIISVTDRASTWTTGNFSFRSDSNGIPRFSFTAPNAPSEALSINGNSVGVQTPSPASVFQVTSNGASNIVSIVKGAASQTANLQEWQDSAGTVLNTITSSGTLVIGGTTPINSSFGITTVNKSIASYYSPNNSAYNASFNFARGNTTGNWMSIGTIGDSANGVASIAIYDTSGNSVFTVGQTGNTAITLRSASNIGLIVKAAASQTANIQEWQNSSGVILSNIRTDGTIAAPYLDNPAASGSYLQANAGASIDIIARVVAQPTFRVRGVSGQTASLQQWQSSAGTVLASIDASGNITDASNTALLSPIGSGSNDATAIQALIDSGKKEIRLGSGQWTFSTRIKVPNGVTIRGTGTSRSSTTGTRVNAVALIASEGTVRDIMFTGAGENSQSELGGGGIAVLGGRVIDCSVNDSRWVLAPTRQAHGYLKNFMSKMQGTYGSVKVAVLGDSLSENTSTTSWYGYLFNTATTATGYYLGSYFSHQIAPSEVDNMAIGGQGAYLLSAQLAMTKDTVRTGDYVNQVLDGDSVSTSPFFSRDYSLAILAIGQNGGEDWKAHLEYTVKSIRDKGIDVIILTQNPAAGDPASRAGDEYFYRSMAETYGCLLIDTQAYFRLEVEFGRALGTTADLFGDGIHQSALGHQLYAKAILNAILDYDSTVAVPANKTVVTRSYSPAQTDRATAIAGLNAYYLVKKPDPSRGLSGVTYTSATDSSIKNPIYGRGTTTNSVATLASGGYATWGVEYATAAYIIYRENATTNTLTVSLQNGGSTLSTLSTGVTDGRTSIQKVVLSGYGLSNRPIRITNTSGNPVQIYGVVFETHADVAFNRNTDGSYPGVKLNGTWSSGYFLDMASYSALKTPYTSTVNDSVTFKFYGDGLRFATSNGKNSGILQVKIDETTYNTVDTYSSISEYGVYTHFYGGLQYGLHTATITLTGANALVTGSLADGARFGLHRISAVRSEWYLTQDQQLAPNSDISAKVNSLSSPTISSEGGSNAVALTVKTATTLNSGVGENFVSFKNSSNNEIAYINDNSYGTSIAQFTYVRVTGLQGWNSVGGIISFANLTPITVSSQNAATSAFAIKGLASQSANLQEWQNSAGTALTSVSPTGALTITNTSAASSLITVNGAGGGQFSVSAYGGISTNAGFQSIGGTSYFGGYGGTSNVVVSVTGASGQTGDLQRWTNFAGTTLAKVDSLGNFTATSKSFDIIHPTKENMRLRYGSLEGPENGVYIRGTAESNIIELPDYWTGLVHTDSITVSLTSVGSDQNIYVEKIENNKIYIGGNLEKAFFTVYGERKDIDKLTVEY